MMTINPQIIKLYSSGDLKMVKFIIEGMTSTLASMPCGVKITARDMVDGASMMLIRPDTDNVVATKLVEKLQKNEDATLVWNCCNQMDPTLNSKYFASLGSVEEAYFKFLFRMNHASWLAKIGDESGFIAYLNDNEKVRRIIRPKYGKQLATLLKFNSQIFTNLKKLLI